MTATFSRATRIHQAVFDEDAYLERTRRNHFWLGGRRGQMALHELKVGVAGLGGMGSNIANALARLGVGQIRIADPDVIERSNMNRQVIASLETLGKTKMDACFDDLLRVAPDADIIGYGQGIVEESVEEFVDGCDVIVDEIDVFPLDKHVILHQAANARGLPIYTAFVAGLGVHVYKFQGTEYTIHDFLGSEDRWRDPTVEYLAAKFVSPLPGYMDDAALAAMTDEARQGNVPIFGASCLLAHSFVATRVVLDHLWQALGSELPAWFERFEPTPLMPRFTSIDGLEMRLSVHDFSQLPAAALR